MFKFGDTGNNFYIILKGSVSVIAKVQNDGDEDEEGKSRSMACVAELGKGKSFGEQALIHNLKRAATIK